MGSFPYSIAGAVLQPRRSSVSANTYQVLQPQLQRTLTISNISCAGSEAPTLVYAPALLETAANKTPEVRSQGSVAMLSEW